MLSSLAIAVGLLFVASPVPQRRTYQPEIGDTVEVYRHVFQPRNLPFGRKAMTTQLPADFARDHLTRMTIIAENISTSEIVVVQFSDPWNASNNRMAKQMAPTFRYDKRPYDFKSFQIFGMNDEGVIPRVGDDLILYWMSMQPRAQAQTKEVLSNSMVDALRHDRQARNSYFCENYRQGEFLSVAFGSSRYRQDRNQMSVMDPLKGQYRSPMRVERFEILSVTREARR